MAESSGIAQLMSKFRNFSSSRVGFLADKIYDISSPSSSDGALLGDVTNRRMWIVVVAREHYHETVTDYPIADVRDLKAVLRLEPRLSPYPGYQFHHLERLTTDSYRVTSWVVKESVVSSMGFRPLLLIPETACLRPFNEIGAVSILRRDQRVLAVSSKDGLKSGLEPLGIKRGAIKSWRNRFLAESGVPRDVCFEELSEEQTGDRYIKGIWQILVKTPTAFTLPIERAFRDDYPWAKLASATLALGCVYTLLTSVYLVSASSWIDYKLGAKLGSSQEALSELRKGNELQERVDEIAQLFMNVPPSWIAWDVVLNLVKFGVKVTRVDGASDEFTIYGTAIKATEVLRFLKEDSRVKSAEFKVPVRQLEDRQQFGVTFILEPLQLEGQSEARRDVSARELSE